jgi:DNA-directed RNA polymerase subunit RPC12/RpoP
MTSSKVISSFENSEDEGNNFYSISNLEGNVDTAIPRGAQPKKRARQKTFEVDLSRLQGEGEFPCPKCASLISPEDESEETYTVVETNGDDESIEEVIIKCKKCNSVILLKGFDELEKAAEPSSVQISEPLEDSKPGLRTTHSISIEGKKVGRTTIEYLQEEDLKAFAKISKSLKTGDAFQARIFIDSSTGTSVASLGSVGLAEIVKVLKKRGKNIRERDIFVVSIEGGKDKLVGRAESLIQDQTG